MHPDWGLNLQPRHMACPDQNSNWRPSTWQDDAQQVSHTGQG